MRYANILHACRVLRGHTSQVYDNNWTLLQFWKSNGYSQTVLSDRQNGNVWSVDVCRHAIKLIKPSLWFFYVRRNQPRVVGQCAFLLLLNFWLIRSQMSQVIGLSCMFESFSVCITLVKWTENHCCKYNRLCWTRRTKHRSNCYIRGIICLFMCSQWFPNLKRDVYWAAGRLTIGKSI